MDVSYILSVGVSSIVLLILIHLAVFYVVRMLYPPLPKQVTFAAPPPLQPVVNTTERVPPPAFDYVPPRPETKEQVTFIQPPSEEEKQNVEVPTYEKLMALATTGQERDANFTSNVTATA